MRLPKTKHTLALLIAVGLAGAPMRVYAEDTSTDPTAATPTTLPTNNFTANGPVAATPVTLPPPPPPPPSQPYDKKASDSAGAAAAGAAIAGAMCAMLMAKAAQEEDPEAKQMLMMQAMAECAQAAAQAANAGQNQNTADQLSQPDSTGTQQAPAVQTYGQATNSGGDNSLLPTDNSGNQLADANSTQDPSPAVYDYGLNSDNGTPSPLPPGAAGSSFTLLKPISPPELSFDDSAKPGGTTPQQSNYPTSMSGFGLGMPSSSIAVAAQTAAAAEDLKNQQLARKPATHSHDDSSGGGGSDSGSSSSSSSSSGGDDGGGALARLLGGGKEMAEPSLTAQLSDISVAKAPGPANTRLPNIFEYASYRFRKSVREGEIKKSRSTPNALTEARNLALVNQ